MLKRMSPTLKKVLGYVAFLGVFYLVGVTKQRLEAFIAIALLTGLYAGLLWLIGKISDAKAKAQV